MASKASRSLRPTRRTCWASLCPVEPPKGVTPQTVARGAGAARPTLSQRPWSSPTPPTNRAATSHAATVPNPADGSRRNISLRHGPSRVERALRVAVTVDATGSQACAAESTDPCSAASHGPTSSAGSPAPMRPPRSTSVRRCHGPRWRCRRGDRAGRRCHRGSGRRHSASKISPTSTVSPGRVAARSTSPRERVALSS